MVRIMRRVNKKNNRGMTLLEVMLALGIMAIILIPMSQMLPNVFRAMNGNAIQNRLYFLTQAMGEYFNRWANNRSTDLDAYWVENWDTSTQWHDFEARNLNELIGVNVNLPTKFRVNITTFGATTYTDKIGFVITVYYDMDASRNLTPADYPTSQKFYMWVAQRGPNL